MHSTPVQQAVTDTDITSTILALYSRSPELRMRKIMVTTSAQHVILSGRVYTDRQYEQSIALAKSVRGVRDVKADNLMVKPPQAPLTDTYITAKVKAVFLKEKLFGTKNIEYWPVTVETKNSVVYLSGKVDSVTQRANLIKLTNEVKGVTAVRSAITVR